MEIISKITEITGYAPVFILAVIAISLGALLYVFSDDLTDIGREVLLWIAVVFFVSAVSVALFGLTKSESYRLRVDDSVTVKELSETYEIIKYDRDTDLWIVKEREEVDGH